VSIKRANLQDLRVDYAYGLVLANQRRYSEAARLLRRYIGTQADDLAAQRVTLWTEIQDKQFEAALDSIAAIGKQLAVRPAGRPSPDQLNTAKYLGVCFAFLEQIEPNGIDKHAVSASKELVLGHFDKQSVSAFEEGCGVVVEQLAAMEATRDSRLKRAKEAESERTKQIAADLSASVDKISSQREIIQSSAEKTKESQRELRTIQQQLLSLAQDRTRLAAQIVVTQTQLSEVQQFIPDALANGIGNNSTPQAANGLVGGDQGTTRVLPLDRIVQAQAFSLALAALNKQAFDMDRLILSLQTRGAELSGTSQAEFKKLAESRAAAEKAAKKAEKLSKRLERQEAESLKRPPRLTGLMTRFSTYAPLPYEEETQRVLGWFAN
jgi:hypothetical protein